MHSPLRFFLHFRNLALPPAPPAPPRRSSPTGGATPFPLPSVHPVVAPPAASPRLARPLPLVVRVSPHFGTQLPLVVEKFSRVLPTPVSATSTLPPSSVPRSTPTRRSRSLAVTRRAVLRFPLPEPPCSCRVLFFPSFIPRDRFSYPGGGPKILKRRKAGDGSGLSAASEGERESGNEEEGRQRKGRRNGDRPREDGAACVRVKTSAGAVLLSRLP